MADYCGFELGANFQLGVQQSSAQPSELALSLYDIWTIPHCQDKNYLEFPPILVNAETENSIDKS